MPIKGNWKKPFADAIKAVQDSKSEVLKLSVAQIFQLARTDSIIYNATEMKQSKKGTPYLKYMETPQMNLYTKPRGKNRKARQKFNRTKFADRTGNLAKSLTPAGGWSGNHLATRGEGEAVVNENESCAIIRFTGRAEEALRGGTRRNAAKIRRNPLDLAGRKIVRFFNNKLKAELDKRTGSMK